MDSSNKIESYVTKKFLLDVITRDINIIDAILELVDNSVDRAIEVTGLNIDQFLKNKDNYKGKIINNTYIKITIKDSEVIVEDNSGGISKEELSNEVFIFGNPKNTDYYGLSAFGIGMKRAFLKLGYCIEMFTRDNDEESKIIWNIGEWIKKGEKDWALDYADEKKLSINLSDKINGTIIRVSKLKPNVEKAFSQNQFLNSLGKKLKTTYALFIRSGIKIIFNDETLTEELPSFYTSKEIMPNNKNIVIEDVSINIITGITPSEDRQPRGWYIFCNGRLILEADKTESTIWKDGLNFHPKFNHFLGFASFTSNNVKSLPWSSTKRNVDPNSPVYINALEEMRIQAKPFLNFLDRWKDVKDDDSVTAIALEELLKNGKQKTFFDISKKETDFKINIKRPLANKTRITFLKDKDIVDKVKDSLGNKKMSNAEMGDLIFDYYVENEID